MATCIICNKDFEAKRSDAKICSPKCRQQANRQGIKLRGEGKSVEIPKATHSEAYDAPPLSQPINDEPPQYVAGIDPYAPKEGQESAVTVFKKDEVAFPAPGPKKPSLRDIFDAPSDNRPVLSRPAEELVKKKRGF